MMQMQEKLSDITPEPLKTTLGDRPTGFLKRFCLVVIFSIAFAYIEAALVVYLRAIFYPDGFTFPLPSFPISQHEKISSIEVGREVASMVLILTAAWLFGQNLQQRFALFLTIFAVWDIFYYIWLKILINWPGSIMEWDILYLIPTTWAGPVLAPVLVSLLLFIFAIIILHRASRARPVKVTLMDWLALSAAAVVVVASFCIAGQYVTQSDFQSHFYWWLFALGFLSAIGLFVKCLGNT